MITVLLVFLFFVIAVALLSIGMILKSRPLQKKCCTTLPNNHDPEKCDHCIKGQSNN